MGLPGYTSVFTTEPITCKYVTTDGQWNILTPSKLGKGNWMYDVDYDILHEVLNNTTVYTHILHNKVNKVK